MFNKFTAQFLILFALFCFTSCDKENDLLITTEQEALAEEKTPSAAKGDQDSGVTVRQLLNAPSGFIYSVTLNGASTPSKFEKVSEGRFVNVASPTDIYGKDISFLLRMNSPGGALLYIEPDQLTNPNTGATFTSYGIYYTVFVGDNPVDPAVQRAVAEYRARDLNGNFWYVVGPIIAPDRLMLKSPAYSAEIDATFSDQPYTHLEATTWTRLDWTYSTSSATATGVVLQGQPTGSKIIEGINIALKSEGFGIDLTNIEPAVLRTTLGDLYKKPVGSTYEITLGGESSPGVWKKTDENTWSPYSGRTNYMYFKLTPKPRSSGSKLDIYIQMYGYIPVLPAGGNPFTPKPVNFTVGDFSDAEGTIKGLYASFATRDNRGGLWFVNVGDGTSSTRLQLRSPNYYANVAFLYHKGPADFINDGWYRMDHYISPTLWGEDLNNPYQPETTTDALNDLVNRDFWPAPKF